MTAVPNQTIVYKVGDVDDAAAILYENDVAVDLTGATVSFVMKKDTTVITISCTLGCIYEGEAVTAASGGVTIPFSAVETATAGRYQAEFVIERGGYVGHNPSSTSATNNYHTVIIWTAL